MRKSSVREMLRDYYSSFHISLPTHTQSPARNRRNERTRSGAKCAWCEFAVASHLYFLFFFLSFYSYKINNEKLSEKDTEIPSPRQFANDKIINEKKRKKSGCDSTAASHSLYTGTVYTRAWARAYRQRRKKRAPCNVNRWQYSEIQILLLLCQTYLFQFVVSYVRRTWMLYGKHIVYHCRCTRKIPEKKNETNPRAVLLPRQLNEWQREAVVGRMRHTGND